MIGGEGCIYYTPLPITRTSKQQQQATTSKHVAKKKFGPTPGFKLWGWPYPVVASPNPGFRLWVAPPHSALLRPQPGGGATPAKKGAKTRPNGPRMAPERTRRSSVPVRTALWWIRGAWHTVGAPQHPALHPPPPVWVRFELFGLNRAGAASKPKNGRISG